MTDAEVDALKDAADIAIESGVHVVVVSAGLVVVPDIELIEAEANGYGTPPAWSLRRDDGRTCQVFQLPPGYER